MLKTLSRTAPFEKVISTSAFICTLFSGSAEQPFRRWCSCIISRVPTAEWHSADDAGTPPAKRPSRSLPSMETLIGIKVNFQNLVLLIRDDNINTQYGCKIVRTATRHYGNGRPETGYYTDVDPDSDSDSECDHRQFSKGNSEFWLRKMRTFHDVIDINKDGVVSFDDFMVLAERFVKLGHLSEKQQRDFQEALKELWEKQWGAIDHYNLITTQQYLHNMQHVVNDKFLRRKAHHFLPYLFKAVDKDKDGEISVEEFKLFFHCLGLDNKAAVHSFSAIDCNKDGSLSLTEFVKLGREFFLTEDEEKPSKHFWGPLIKP